VGLKNRKKFTRMCEERGLFAFSVGDSACVNVIARWWEGDTYRQRLLGNVPYNTFTDPVDWDQLEQLVVEWELTALFQDGGYLSTGQGAKGNL
jgi:hypothetical protein